MRWTQIFDSSMLVYISTPRRSYGLHSFRGSTSSRVSCRAPTDQHIKQTPHELLPKLFGPLRERYADRPGGYTRVLRVEPKKDDQAPSAILELVDGPKDIRFAMTAKTVARQRSQGFETLNELTALNVKKVTQFRKNGIDELEDAIKRMERMELKEKKEAASPKKSEAEAKE